MYQIDPDELASARAGLVKYGERLLADGLSVGSAGNLSVRVGDAVAITPSGVAYQDMTAAGICLVTPVIPVDDLWHNPAELPGRRPLFFYRTSV